MTCVEFSARWWVAYKKEPMTPAIDFFDSWTTVGRVLNSHPRLPSSAESLRGEMRRCHVGRALVVPAEPKWWDPKLANRHISELATGSLSPVWMALPGDAGDFPEPEKLVGDLDRHGVVAVQILPKTQVWNPFGRRAAHLFDALAEGGWPVFIRLGDEIDCRDLEDLALRHPRNRWIAVNAAWYEQRALLGMLRATENVWMTSERYHSNFGIEHLCEMGLVDRLLFASNAPAAAMGAARAYVDWAQIPLEARQAVAGGSLMKLLRQVPEMRERDYVPADGLMQDSMAGRPLRCGVIDCHAHILESGLHSGGMPVMLHGDSEGLLKMGNILGVEQTGIMSWVGIQTEREDEGHRVVTEAVDRHSGRFWGLATIQVSNKSDAVKIAQLETLRSGRRILGLKPYTTFGIAYSDSRYDALWAYAEREGLYLGLHPFLWYRPDEFVSIAERFPALRILAYHAGCTYEIADTVINLCQRYPNIDAEINYSSVTGGVIEYLVEQIGTDRVFYGSDQPLRDPRQQLGWVVYADLGEDQKTAILSGNARRLLSKIEGHS